MSDEEARVVVIGCGYFAENHLNAWSRLDGARIVGVCDLDGAKAAAAAKRFGVEDHGTDAARLLQETAPDIVDIATTVGSHRALVEMAAARGRVLVCQKPFAETMADGRAMVEAADRAGATLMVHENFRWQRGFVTLRRLIEEGRIGTPHFARIAFRHGFDVYANQPYLAEVERLSLMDVGLHLFDLARYLMGEVDTLACLTQRLNPKVRGEDAFTALLSHAGGAVSVCDASFFSRIAPDPFPQTIAWIEGPEGTLSLDRGYRLTVHDADGLHPVEAEAEVPVWGSRPSHVVQDSVARFEAHVLDVARGRAQPQPSGEDNLHTLALALAAYEAAAERRTIAMREWMENA